MNSNDENKETYFVKQEDKELLLNLKKKIEDLNAENVKISNVNGLTSNNVKGAIQELFTNADNAQKGISNVIGSPLSASDTLTTQKDKIQALKNTFASNLNSKGQNATGNESLDSLINKVSNAGKRVVTGSSTINIDQSSSGSKYFSIHYSIDFTPTMVFVIVNDYIKTNTSREFKGGISYFNNTKYPLAFWKEFVYLTLNFVTKNQLSIEFYNDYDFYKDDINIKYILIE